MSWRKIAIPTVMLAGLLLTGCGGAGKTPRSTAAARRRSKPSPATTAAGPISTTAGHLTASSREVAPGVVVASAKGITATMRVAGHRPRVNAAWPVSFSVEHAGKDVQAQVRYQYLFAGQIVARRSHYRFDGRFHDVFRWPSSAVGYPLTFRAVVTVGSATLDLDYQVQVQS